MESDRDELAEVIFHPDAFERRVNYTSGAVAFYLTDDQLEDLQEADDG